MKTRVPEAQPQGGELLPCPWCGQPVRAVAIAGAGYSLVGCSDLSCPASSISCYPDEWNTRANLPRATADDALRVTTDYIADCERKLRDVSTADRGTWIHKQQGAMEVAERLRIAPRATGETTAEPAVLDDTALRGSVEITVFRGDRVLAVNSRNFDGFCGVGGKVEPGESFEQAARRELMEETGCKALLIQFVAGHTLDPIKGDDATTKWYCAGFIVDIGDQEPRPTEPGTTPFWTTRENMIQNSLFPEWYAWWFGVLNLCVAQVSAATRTEGEGEETLKLKLSN